MYVNEKIRPVETIQGIGERRYRRMMEWVNSSMIYLTYVTTLVNATMYPKHNNKNIGNCTLYSQRFLRLMNPLFTTMIQCTF
jgi:hypothetical protein